MIVTQTPLRISFLGGGTDYPEYFRRHGGLVLGTAIDCYSNFIVSRLNSDLLDYRIRIVHSQAECVDRLDDITHGPARECLRRCNVDRDIQVIHSADLPAFTGLGSSSSFVVGLLRSLHAFRNQTIAPLNLAYQAIDIERNALGESVGCQDQTFAAVGGFNLIEFKDLDDFAVHSVPLSTARRQEIEKHLLLFYSGIRRRSEHFAARQVMNVLLNQDKLGEMKRLAEEGFKLLSGSGSLSGFGELLDRAWLLKRNLADGISNDHIDQIYKTAMDAGAFGGKLLGAGGGGFILLLVPPERRAAVKASLSHLIEVDFSLDAPGSRVIHP